MDALVWYVRRDWNGSLIRKECKSSPNQLPLFLNGLHDDTGPFSTAGDGLWESLERMQSGLRSELD